MSTARWGLLPLLLGAAFLATACGGGTYTSSDTDDPGDPNDPRVDNGFESDDPVRPRRGYDSADASAGADNAGSSGAPEKAPSSSDDAARAIEEADIVKIEGNRLYALSRYGGLAIIDTSNPDALKLVGRKRLDGEPFEFYLRGNRAYVMLNDFGRYVPGVGGRYGSWVQTSEMLAIDVSNEADIKEFAHYDVPGTIADSRLVGDAIYVVTNENGSCWGCQQNLSGAVVSSFDIGGGGIAKVGELSYRTANNYSYQRSVSATNERMYIAGPSYDWSPGAQGGHSVIQVVDIRDPHGALVKGADLPVSGQIQSRWQMDESNGILRVVSQNGNGWGNGVNPLVQTFTVTSASTITPLGSTELVLPSPESLRSVRFDGERGYAITAERSDPLFTIDLSDPAHPRQAAELHMPGWITHMEPRGDRLVGFGFAETNWSSKLAVSLFDVTSLDSPVMLERVEFGQGGGQYAEDQDRIHKSVQVLDDKGLILVPFASYGYWNDGTCSAPQSGIQLIDYSRDHITARGVAPQYGQPRRAMIAGDRLLAMSDRNVTSFDITQRDAPTKKSEIDLSNPAYRLARVGDQIASITNDWWTSEVMLSLTPHEGADDAAVTGKLSLAGLADPAPELCSGNASSWAQWYDARLFALSATQLVVSVPIYSYSNDTASSKLVYGVIDTSNPLEPKLLSKTTLPMSSSVGYGYYGGFGFFDGWGYYNYFGGSLLSDGESMVQVGAKLAYLENQFETTPSAVDVFGNTTYTTTVHRTLHVVDFSNAAAPSVAAPVVLGDSKGTFPLIVRGNEVLTSRWRNSPTTAGKVKFYVDRIDLGGAVPERKVSVNTPGSLLASDAPSGRLVTVDYTRTDKESADYMQCYADNQGMQHEYDESTHVCSTLSRTFKLSDLQGDTVSLRNTFTPPSQALGGIKVADDRVYVTHYSVYDYNSTYGNDGQMPAALEQGGLYVLGGIRSGALQMVSEFQGDAQWPLAALGTKVALYTQEGLAIYDTAQPIASLLAQQTLRGWGYTSDVLLEQDRAVCSLGEWGMQTVLLP